MNEVQFLDADLHAAAVQVSEFEFHRHRMSELPRHDCLLAAVEQRDRDLQARSELPGRDRVENLPHAAICADAALENHGGERDPAGALRRAIVAATLFDGLGLHGGFEAGAFGETHLHGGSLRALRQRIVRHVNAEAEYMKRNDARGGHQLACAIAAMPCALAPLVSSASVTRISSMLAAALKVISAMSRPLSRSFCVMVLASQRTEKAC